MSNHATSEELRKGLSAIGRYLTAYRLSQERALLHIPGQYGTGAVFYCYVANLVDDSNRTSGVHNKMELIQESIYLFCTFLF